MYSIVMVYTTGEWNSLDHVQYTTSDMPDVNAVIEYLHTVKDYKSLQYWCLDKSGNTLDYWEGSI